MSILTHGAMFVLGMLFMNKVSSDTRKNIEIANAQLAVYRKNKAMLNRLIIQTIRQMYIDGTLEEVINSNPDDPYTPDYSEIIELAKQDFLKDATSAN